MNQVIARPLLGFARRLVVTTWLGILWSVGYLAAPLLFEMLDDTRMAGEIAGQLFHVVAWLSLLAGGLLLGLLPLTAARGRLRTAKLASTGMMMSLICAMEWIVRPMMESARLPDGSAGEQFLVLHGVSAVMYLLASLLGMVLLWPGQDKSAPEG